MIRRRNSKALRRASWLAIFAVLLQALLPALHHPASMVLGGLAGGKIAGFDISQNLCADPGGTAPAAPDKAPANHIPPCAICLALHAIAGAPPPSLLAMPIPGEYAQAVSVVRPVILTAQANHVHQQPRAPPSLA